MTTPTISPCSTCRSAVLPGDRFCATCGATIDASASSGVAPQKEAGSRGATTIGYSIEPSPWEAIAAQLQAATLGEYEILTELGQGGMASVYLARDLALNRRVAIKVMAPGLLLGTGMIERFRREAVTVANLQHAHIVSIHGVRQHGDLHYFVMQFVPGRTLERVLRESGALPIQVVRAWLYQIGSALNYAHRRGVIHRDVKPGNILLNGDGEAVVTDFGIAKVAETPNQTQTGTVVGTPIYMSPEQCYAKELTGSSDQYSLGVVAYEMLTGRPPFRGSSFELMRSHTDSPPPPLRQTRPDIPVEMETAILRMLAKTPEERFASVPEALATLGATPLSPDDTLHGELERLAAAADRLGQLADVIRTPVSPVPKTRERPKATLTPAAPVTVPTPDDVAPIRPAPPAPAVTPRAAKSGSIVRWVVPAALAAGAAAYIAMRPQSAPPSTVAAAVTKRVDPPPNVAPSAAPIDSASSATATNGSPSPTSPAVADSAPVSKAISSPPSAPRTDTVTVARAAPMTTPRQADTRVVRPASKTESAARAQSRPPASSQAATDAPRQLTVAESAPPPAPATPASAETPKSEAEHRTEIQTVIGSYVRAIEQRDTSLIRRVFPGAGDQLLSRWQTTFDDARGPIAMSNGTIEILDTPRDAAGSQVHTHAKYVARFSSKAARSDQSFPVTFTAVLQRDAGTWHITSIR